MAVPVAAMNPTASAVSAVVDPTPVRSVASIADTTPVAHTAAATMKDESIEKTPKAQGHSGNPKVSPGSMMIMATKKAQAFYDRYRQQLNERLAHTNNDENEDDTLDSADVSFAGSAISDMDPKTDADIKDKLSSCLSKHKAGNKTRYSENSSALNSSWSRSEDPNATLEDDHLDQIVDRSCATGPALASDAAAIAMICNKPADPAPVVSVSKVEIASIDTDPLSANNSIDEVKQSEVSQAANAPIEPMDIETGCFGAEEKRKKMSRMDFDECVGCLARWRYDCLCCFFCLLLVVIPIAMPFALKFKIINA
jgi:hypothetical protein